MRKRLLGAALLLVAGILLTAAAGFFSQQQGVSSPIAKTSIAEIEPLPGPGREHIPATEATPAVASKLLPPGTKSLLKVPASLKHGEHVWNDTGVPTGKLTIWVDLRRQMISAFRGGHEIGTAVIVYGAEDMSSPEGIFRILRKSRDYHSRAYDAPMPHSLFINNNGVALHGSPMSKRRASHGCIGLPFDFAGKLFEAANVGDTVEITRSDAKPLT